MRRFPALSYGFRCSPSRACDTVVACAVLHNLGIERGDVMGRVAEELEMDGHVAAVGPEDNHGARIRECQCSLRLINDQSCRVPISF